MCLFGFLLSYICQTQFSLKLTQSRKLMNHKYIHNHNFLYSKNQVVFYKIGYEKLLMKNVRIGVTENQPIIFWGKDEPLGGYHQLFYKKKTFHELR